MSSCILVVEDDPLQRAPVVRALSRLPDVEVYDAASLTEAKKVLRAVKPRMVISDLDLPDGSGIDVIACLDSSGLRIPILLMSAFLARYQRRIPMSALIDIRAKPVPLDTLLDLVRARLNVKEVKEAAEPAPFTATDYVQLACMARRTVALVVERGGQTVGTILCHQGEIWSARDAKGSGPEALRRLLFDVRSTVGCRAVDKVEEPRNVEGSWQHELMEAARLADEAAHERG
jgi:CheY-like chemotaxis protein